MDLRGLKVAFVCLDDVSDPHVISGGPTCIRRAFAELGCTLIDIFPIRPAVRYAFLPRKVACRLMGRFYHWEWEPLFLRRAARHVERVLERTQPDLVYVVQPQLCAELVTDIPVAMSHDQSFVERLSYFPFEQRPPARAYVDQAIAQEGKAFRAVDLIAYPSVRSIDTIRDSYGIAQDKLAMIPWGGNLPSEPDDAEARAVIAARSFGPFELVFIGVDWPRKGGDIALEAHRALRERGIDTHLTIIGVAPPDPVDGSVTVIPFLDKADPEHFARLKGILTRAHLLVVPSRVEAFGHVFCEAAAFGVPSIATDVGGIPTIIEDGINGRLLSLQADGEEFADAIQATLADESAYRAMALASRERYETTLNWRAFCSAIIERLRLRPAHDDGT